MSNAKFLNHRENSKKPCTEDKLIGTKLIIALSLIMKLQDGELNQANQDILEVICEESTMTREELKEISRMFNVENQLKVGETENCIVQASFKRSIEIRKKNG
jgi:hypothetical protein